MKTRKVKAPKAALEFDASRYRERRLGMSSENGGPGLPQARSTSAPAAPAAPDRSIGKASKGKKSASYLSTTAHRPQVPLHAGSIIPVATLLRLVGLPDYSEIPVPMIRPGDVVDDTTPWPRLVLRMPSNGGNRGTWTIADRASETEWKLLGRSDGRVRISTGCREGDEDKAIEKLRAYHDLKLDRMLGRILPTQITMASVFANYIDVLDDGGDGLAVRTIATYKIQLRPLIDFFGHLRLGGIDRKACLAYAADRRTQPVVCNGAKGRLVSEKQIEHELATLRRAINVYKETGQVNLDVPLYVPTADRRPCVSLKRLELSRYFWAVRGRVWNDAAKRWRIRRDDDSSLIGPEGDERVLRSPEIVASRKSLGRLLLLGIYTGSRVGVLISTSYDDENTAHVDWERGAIERRGAHEKETSKKRPTVLLPAKMARFLRNWATRDMAEGIRHPIHKANGAPYSVPIAATRWRTVDADAGCGKHMHAHAMRHTAATFLKAAGCSVWVAAEFLGYSPFVLVERYGAWDLRAQQEAAEAIGYGKRARTTELLAIRYDAKPPKGKLH